MWKQTLAAVLLAVSLVACKEEPMNGNTSQIVGGKDVRLLSTQIVSTGESSPEANSGPVSYLLVHLELTNTESHAFIPDIARFFFTTKFADRAQGHDSGSSVFIGISNSRDPLPPGAKHDYYVGFQIADQNPLGEITYEP